MAAPGHTQINNTNPAEYSAAITKSDSTTFSATRALYVGTGGDVVVTMAGDGAEMTFTSVPSGKTLAVRVTQVKAATTASNIVGLW